MKNTSRLRDVVDTRFIQVLCISLVLSVGHIYSSPVSAEFLDVAVSTDQGQTIIIDVTNNISGITSPSVSVATQPQNGSADAIVCPRTGEKLCVSYTPNADFSGVDLILVSVLNNDNEVETATIAVSVSGAVAETSGVVPDDAVRDTLDAICGSEQATEVDVLCQGFNAINATQGEVPEDLRELLEALTPQDIAAQGTTSNVLAAQQLENIGKHLAALRRGQKNAALGGFSFRQNKYILPGSLLSEALNANEGVAQEIFGINWGWFLNGNLGGGKQDASDFENGFDFVTDGLSTGIDYRLGNAGVLGVAFGFGNTNLDISHNQGELKTYGYNAVAYASFYASEKAYVDIIASTNQHQFDASRRIVFGNTDAFATSNNKSLATAINLAAGYELFHLSGLTANLTARGEYMNTVIDGYTEQGDSPFNVTVSERQIEKYTATLGATMTYAMSFSWAVLLPQFDVFAVRQIERGGDLIEGYFSSDPEKNLFQFNTNAPDESFMRVEFGVSGVFAGGHSAYLQAGTTLSRSDYQNWTTSLGYRTEF